MAVTKHILDQYSDLRKEIEEVQEKIDKLNVEIPKIEKRIHEIENGEKVKDKVRGGDGGNQSFNIEGIPIKEYEQKKTALYSKKLLLIQRKTTLELLKLEIEQKKNDVEEYIASIDDSRMRRIVNMRFIDNLSWNQVADRIGGGNTEGSVKMAFQRFMIE